MKLTERFKKDGPTLSFEFFPPKTDEQENDLYRVIGELKELSPDFVSVTYGALGNTREKTFKWAERIKKEFNMEPVAHLTCVAADRSLIKEQVIQLEEMGVSNILALRGDPPSGEEKFAPPANGFSLASELVGFIKKTDPRICVGVAGYPEGHPETRDLILEIGYLKEKVEAGAEFVITQLFFDNMFFFEFKRSCREAGINVPLIPGIMPVTSLKQIKKMTDTCGAMIPEKLLNELEGSADDPEAVREIGIRQAVDQCSELLKHGAEGLHFFVMNRSASIKAIFLRLQAQGLL